MKQSEAPYYRSASEGILVAYVIKLVANLLLLGKVMLCSSVLQFRNGLTLSAYMLYINRYRDRTYGAANKKQSDEAGMQDKTEFENKNFRYVL